MRAARAAIVAAFLCAPLAARATARFAVIAGNNAGAPGRQQLWFAERDAERLARALSELGDFSEDHVVVLRGGGAGGLRDALARVEQQIALARAGGERALLVVYFSGHAGAGGLELGAEKISYDDLRALVSRSAAEAKVAIVDACEAGSLTQVKGVRVAPALDFALPDGDNVQGTAYIASTAVGEAAQESAAIGGSFFTHHLEIALRGAGDADGDGQVTLAEAFRYTAARTVVNTAQTEAGPQHPTYDMRMSGRGDVVLADLRRAEARLRLPEDPGATYVVRGPRELFAEIPGASERLLLALPAGHYAIERRGDGGPAATELTLARGELRDLPRLSPTRYELARAKGGPLPVELFMGGGLSFVPLPNFGAAPLVRVGGRRELGSFALRLRFDYARKSVVDQRLAYGFSQVGAGAALLVPLQLGRVLVEVGPELGYAYASQSLADGRTFWAGDASAGAAALVTMRAGPLRLGLDAGIAAHLFRLDDASVVRPGASLALLVLYGL